ncbi:MAG: bifunctional phosphopantothenoylcysteine decarboxylase/phosphopantothenate--cysteine ligase CoaBC [Mogibacterium sp.]|nr:bifunctional phosphopantothenoylcysteine decarboxylase/phosphopantothenate--cysteine ligase CoaBC [Mogibacterium sp.]
MLKGKTIILGVTGGIAAYKSVALASLLVKKNAEVHVIMTKNAQNFVGPISFEAITGTRCITETFDRNHEYSTEHVALAKRADIFIVAPATANTIAKLAHGIADDMLTTTFLACSCAKIVAPAMNTGMYDNPATQANMQTLAERGIAIAETGTGWLACGDEGKGRMLEPEQLFEYIQRECVRNKSLAGKKVLVTAGPTKESLDPVRFISNHSSGKMGYALAKAAAHRGAEVVLVSGDTALTPSQFVEVVSIKNAEDMFNAVTERSGEMDIIIKAAAVADYKPKTVAKNKIKKSGDDMVIEMERTEDILAYLGEHKKDGQFVCGFAMETENLLENAAGKLKKKNADMIVANNLKVSGAGFGTDTNVVTILTADGNKMLEIMSKEAVADAVLDEISARMK